MKLVIHGNKENKGSIPPKLEEIKDLLDHCKEHHSFTAVQLCREVNAGWEYLRHRGPQLPEGYRIKINNAYVYGNKKTIKNIEDGIYDER